MFSNCSSALQQLLIIGQPNNGGNLDTEIEDLFKIFGNQIIKHGTDL
jgi:hypothetical protein